MKEWNGNSATDVKKAKLKRALTYAAAVMAAVIAAAALILAKPAGVAVKAAASIPVTTPALLPEEKPSQAASQSALEVSGAEITLPVSEDFTEADCMPPAFEASAEADNTLPVFEASAETDSMPPAFEASVKADNIMPVQLAQTAAADADMIPIETFAAEPLIYENEKGFFAASGKNNIYLGGFREMGGCLEAPDIAFSGDKRYIFYMSEYDVFDGYGILIRIAADGKSDPTVIASGVYRAEASGDGESVLYMTDYENGMGRLYLWSGSAYTFISADTLDAGFSAEGQCIYYTARESCQLRLYVRTTGEDAQLVRSADIGAEDDGSLGEEIFRNIIPGEDGKTLYTISDGLLQTPMYLYTPGYGADKLSADGRIIAVLDGPDNILFTEWGTTSERLYYRSGSETALLSEDFEDVVLPESGGERFLLAEGGENGYMLYEQSLSGDRVFIAEADAEEDIIASPALDAAAYMRGGAYYAARKTEQGWEEQLLCETAQDEYYGYLIEGIFDANSSLYYYDSINYGPLYIWHADDGSVQQALKSTEKLYSFNGNVYAINTRGTAYRLTDGTAEEMLGGVLEIRGAAGGVYLLTRDGGIFYSADSGKGVVSADKYIYTEPGSELAGITGMEDGDTIERRVPLSEDAAAAFEVLADDMYYCIYELSGGGNIYRRMLTAEEECALAVTLAELSGEDEKKSALLGKMKDGFELYGLWENGDGDKRKAALSRLKSARTAYEYYMSAQEQYGAGVE